MASEDGSECVHGNSYLYSRRTSQASNVVIRQCVVYCYSL